MALTKPYIVKLKSGGQATLLYMSQERTEALEKLLLNYEKDGSSSELKEQAFTIVRNPTTKKYELVTINFSLDTKEAIISNVEVVAERKNWALVALERAFQKIGIM